MSSLILPSAVAVELFVLLVAVICKVVGTGLLMPLHDLRRRVGRDGGDLLAFRVLHNC